MLRKLTWDFFRSLLGNAQAVTDSLSALVLSRLTLRAINALPPVKQIVARRLGEE